MRPLDLTGIKFGRLLALDATELRSRGSVVWRCVCDCGKEVSVPARSLANKHPGSSVRSCGCLRREQSAINATAWRHKAKVA